MNEHQFLVTVNTETAEQAEQVMCERIGPDEDYGFEYRIDWKPLPKVWVTAVEHVTTYVNRTEAGALDALYQFVASFWNSEDLEGMTVTREVGEEDEVILAVDQYDKATAIEIYFELVNDESWTLTESEVKD